MAMTGPYLKARTIERERVARIDYRYLRGEWSWCQAHSFPAVIRRALLRALMARERWSVLHDLLREPDWIDLRVNGLDADDLALLAGGAA